MQLPTISIPQILVASLLAVQVYADTISLTQFQKIEGFSSGCTAVYDGIVDGCSSNDFQNGGPCGEACVKGLLDITHQLKVACAGISTSPTTLIGLFLREEGVGTLCPKIASAASASVSSELAASTTAAATTAATTSSTSSQTDASSTSSSTPTFATLHSSLSSTTADSTQSTSSTSSTQTSISFAMTGSTAATATPASGGFGGDIGDLNGPSNGASNWNLNLLSIWLVVTGLTIGLSLI